jgi:vacuolar-type H+-ATPase subunit I/STV1
MALVPMQKVAVVAHRKEKESIVKFLHDEGVMEIADMPEASSIAHDSLQYRSAELESVIAKLTEIATKQTLAEAAKKPTWQQIKHAGLTVDIRGIIDRMHALEQEHGNIERSLLDLQKGQMPTIADGQNAAEEGTYFTSSKVKSDLSHFGGVGAGESPSPEMIAVAKAKTEDALNKNREELFALSAELPHLVRAKMYAEMLDEHAAVSKAMKETRSTITLFGWIAKHLFEPLERKLQTVSPATAIVALEPAEGEQAPVMIKNPTILKPFESVTTLYGLPQAHEVDPTPLIAPFFILFFGLCLTDAGYGLVLALIMGTYLFSQKKSIEEARLWWLLFMGGIFTFFVSIPFGGWFGLMPSQVQHFAPWSVIDTNSDGTADLFVGQIWNLGETPGITFFQNLSLALGIIHLSFGFFMSGFNKWRGGSLLEAFWADWTTLILFALIGGYFLVPADMQQWALYAIYAGVAMVVWGKGYGSAWYLRPLYGLLGLLNLSMGMLSNTLSYLRLLALGLVTGALALAVNLVAQQIGALFPWFIGIPVSIAIYIVGHTVNVALNVLGAFIHSGRLQFVEFFGQFFEGGGTPFTPFKRKYIVS